MQPMRQPDTPTSVLGQDITISGQQLVLKTKGSLLIAGHIQGDVHGESVTVGETGSVTGTITARTITVQGEVRGALKGSAVILNNTSRVDGDIVKQTLAIAEGAQFDGSVRRANSRIAAMLYACRLSASPRMSEVEPVEVDGSTPK